MTKANIVPSITDIKELLKFVPKTAIIQSLRRQGKISSAPSSDGFYSALNKWIAKGKISYDDLCNAVYDVEENGGKHIFLKVLKGELPQTKKAFDTFLVKNEIPTVQKQRRSFRGGTKPTLNHIIWESKADADFILIKFSEIQEDHSINFETGRVTYEPKPVFIVIKIDPKTGFTEIRFDHPFKRHIHKDVEGFSNTDVFYSYYFGRLQQLFPGIEIEPFGLSTVCDYMVAEKVKYRLSRDSSRVTGNGKQIYSTADGDVRDLPARKAAEAKDGSNWVYDDLTGYWIASASDGVLVKDLFMRLSKVDSTINFQRDCLGVELDYAISKIRGFKEEIQGL